MAPAATPAVASAERVPALDLLRGFAALLMVFNHVGYAALTPRAATSGVSGALVFLGSFAPVLFFFATGFGAALTTRPVSWRSVADKLLLLVLADQFLRWSNGATWGLDFFGFIAVCTLTAALAMAAPRPALAAGLGIVAVVALRYVVGKPLDAMLDGYGLASWVLGVTPHDAVSYPAAPWLVYPLLGVVMGVLHRRRHGRVSAQAWVLMGVAAVLGAAGAWLLISGGASLHRWGSVAAAYFSLSVTVLLGFVALSVALTRVAPRLAEVLSLGGIASFAVVPLHYAFVRGAIVRAHESVGLYLVGAGAIAAASFWLSNRFERASHTLAASGTRSWWVGVALVVIGAAGAAALAWGRAGWPLPAQAAATVGQLAICLLFAWRVGLLAPARVPAR